MAKTTVLYVSGVGRSGSTLIERALATDPRVVVLGEVTHLWRRSLLMDELCGCGRSFSWCPFWGSVGQRAFGGWRNVDVEKVLASRARLDRVSRFPRLLRRLGDAKYRRDLRDYGELYARIYGAAAEVTGAEVVVDSSKQPSTPYILSHQPDLDLRVLHCVRDSRAVAYSWTKTVQRPEAQVESFGNMTQYSPFRMAVVWMTHNWAAGATPLTGAPVLRIRYEDWVRSPVQETARIMALCGHTPSPTDALTDSYVNLTPSHTCSGNPLRFATGRIDIKMDDAWRRNLPMASRRLVTGLTSPLLRKYGYLETYEP